MINGDLCKTPVAAVYDRRHTVISAGWRRSQTAATVVDARFAEVSNGKWQEVRRRAVGARFLRALVSHGPHGGRVYWDCIDPSITQGFTGHDAFSSTKLWSGPEQWPRAEPEHRAHAEKTPPPEKANKRAVIAKNRGAFHTMPGRYYQLGYESWFQEIAIQGR